MQDKEKIIIEPKTNKYRAIYDLHHGFHLVSEIE